MIFRTQLILAASLAIILAAVPAVAQEPGDDAPAAKVHEKLKPLSWLIGNWEGGNVNFAGGDVRYYATNRYSWVLGGQALLERWSNRNTDGEVTESNYTLIFVDPETGNLRQWGVSARGYVNTGTTTNVDNTESNWDWQLVHPSGDVGTFKYRIRREGNEFRKGWSKVSGKGGNVAMTFRRISDEEAKSRQSENDPEPADTMKNLAWLAGEWKTVEPKQDAPDIHRDKITWILQGKAMLGDWQSLNSDGDVTEHGYTVYYLDSMTKSPATWTFTRSQHVASGKSLKVSEDGVTWQVRVVWSEGGQGHYTHTLSRDGDDAFKSHTTKISGEGPDSFGDKRFERVGKAAEEDE